MAYPSKFDELEKKHKKPIREILVQKLNELQSVERLAADIGVSYRWTFEKVQDCGIEKDPPHWHLREVENVSQ